jgi:hypothetical protein
MTLLSVALSGFVAILGAIGIVWPTTLLGIARFFGTASGLYAAAALRIVFGAALFMAAPGSRAPRALRVVGVLIFVGGLITPLIGLERARAILDWWSAQSSVFVRAWAGFALAVGSGLLWTLLPKPRAV